MLALYEVGSFPASILSFCFAGCEDVLVNIDLLLCKIIYVVRIDGTLCITGTAHCFWLS